MNRCPKCGIQLSNNAKFCEKCGYKLEQESYENKNEKNADGIRRTYSAADFEKKKKDRRLLLTIMLWVFLLPVMAVISISKSTKLSKPVKGILIALIVIFTIGMLVSNSVSANEEAQNQYDKIVNSIESKEYLQAEEQANQLISDYPNSKFVAEVKFLLESNNEEIDKARQMEKEKIEKQERLAEEKEKNEAAESAILKNIEVIMNGSGLTKAEAEAVYANLESVGVTSITKCESAIGTGVDELQSFTVLADGKEILLTIEKRKTYYIGSGGVDLFDSTKGGVLGQITDYGLTSSDFITFTSAAEHYITQILKAPSTAEFPGVILEPDQWAMGRYKNIVQVQSYVDSQNSFGAMIRTPFVIQMAYDNQDCLYIQFDGEKVFGTYSKMSN